MTDENDSTLVSLFHTEDQAQKTLSDLRSSGIPTSAVKTISKADEIGSDTSLSMLQKLDLPTGDMQLLSDGVRTGGTVVIVTATGKMAEKAEAIFRRHHSRQVDEQILGDDAAISAPLTSGRKATELEGQTIIPVVEEELLVGKRTVQGGGVRVISRVTETPVTESITLREEHAYIERRPADRAATEADLRSAEEVIEVAESAEEAVVGKNARVVEEVVVGKDSSQRTEKVTDTVRKTEVEVEQLAADGVEKTKKTRP